MTGTCGLEPQNKIGFVGIITRARSIDRQGGQRFSSAIFRTFANLEASI